MFHSCQLPVTSKCRYWQLTTGNSLPHRLQRPRQIPVTLKPMLQPRDLEDLPAVLVQVGELDLAEEVLGLALDPEERFQAFAVNKAGFLKIDDEVHDLFLFDELLDMLAQGFTLG